ncbi:ribose-phosphate diphosphokinase [Azospirillum sp. ST 5-10]|uniref:ribose-phosphate diphosphokinase n=1 Tax=unclassified Azospirillum TaxID=2630922 RepID=UPI003F4A18DB
MPDDILLFDLDPRSGLGGRVAHRLGTALAAHEERTFADGELKLRPVADVRGRDVFVLQSLAGDGACGLHDRLCRLLFFAGAVRDAGAARLTAVVPYLAYARQDRRTRAQDPLTLRYLAALVESVGVDAVVTVDVHNPAAFENAFRCRTEILEAGPLLLDGVAPWLGEGTPVVVSPDAGGIKRADRVRQRLAARLGTGVGMAFLEKTRGETALDVGTLFGDVGGRTALILDDMISTGATMAAAAAACRAAGCRDVVAAATHGVFAPGAAALLGDPAVSRLVVTDTLAPDRLPPGTPAGRVAVLETAPLLADAIARRHGGPLNPG